MLDLVSPWSTSYTVSMPWAASLDTLDPTPHNPLNPDDARFFDAGEWLQDDGNGNLRRGNGVEVGHAYQVFGERGRTDLPAMAGAGRGVAGKVTVIRIHQYEGITDVCDWSVVSVLPIGSGLEISNDVVAPHLGRRGLDAVTTGFVQARLVSVDIVNSRIRFMVRS